MSNASKTDWKRLAQMKDEQIDTSDIAELDDEFFKNAELRLPTKKPITIRVDDDVLEWFKAQGQGYQTRINQLMRRYMETHQSPQ
jgi:uncharacterized protein (DUF4415 family)